MSGRMVIIDKLPVFATRANIVMDDAVREGARDTLTAAKNRAPLRKGGLRSDTQIKHVALKVYRVSFFKEYARFQEFGGDAKRRVRNYTTPDTGAHFLRDSGDAQMARMPAILRKHARRARV